MPLLLFSVMSVPFFFSSGRRHMRCALVSGVQTCALPISSRPAFGAPMLNRRHFIASATLAGVAAPAILRAEGGLFRDFPFSLGVAAGDPSSEDRKSTRLNSSH